MAAALPNLAALRLHRAVAPCPTDELIPEDEYDAVMNRLKGDQDEPPTCPITLKVIGKPPEDASSDEEDDYTGKDLWRIKTESTNTSTYQVYAVSSLKGFLLSNPGSCYDAARSTWRTDPKDPMTRARWDVLDLAAFVTHVNYTPEGASGPLNGDTLRVALIAFRRALDLDEAEPEPAPQLAEATRQAVWNTDIEVYYAQADSWGDAQVALSNGFAGDRDITQYLCFRALDDARAERGHYNWFRAAPYSGYFNWFLTHPFTWQSAQPASNELSNYPVQLGNADAYVAEMINERVLAESLWDHSTTNMALVDWNSSTLPDGTDIARECARTYVAVQIYKRGWQHEVTNVFRARVTLIVPYKTTDASMPFTEVLRRISVKQNGLAQRQGAAGALPTTTEWTVSRVARFGPEDDGVECVRVKFIVTQVRDHRRGARRGRTMSSYVFAQNVIKSLFGTYQGCPDWDGTESGILGELLLPSPPIADQMRYRAAGVRSGRALLREVPTELVAMAEVLWKPE